MDSSFVALCDQELSQAQKYWRIAWHNYTFQCFTQKGGKGLGGEATITLRAGDVLAQQSCSRFNGSQQQQPWCVVSNSSLRYQH